jgi:hypothetical protein
MQNSGGAAGKVRNPSITNIQQQHSAGGMAPAGNDGPAMKNYKKAAAVASRTRPRSQTGHQAIKD